VLGRGSGGDKGRGLVPIHVGSRHLIRVLEAEARKLERAPLNRQVIVAITRNYLGSRLMMDAHRSSLRPSPRERIGGMPALISHALSAVAHAKTSAGTISAIIADSLSPRTWPSPRRPSGARVVAEEPKGDTQVSCSRGRHRFGWGAKGRSKAGRVLSAANLKKVVSQLPFFSCKYRHFPLWNSAAGGRLWKRRRTRWGQLTGELTHRPSARDDLCLGDLRRRVPRTRR